VKHWPPNRCLSMVELTRDSARETSTNSRALAPLGRKDPIRWPRTLAVCRGREDVRRAAQAGIEDVALLEVTPQLEGPVVARLRGVAGSLAAGSSMTVRPVHAAEVDHRGVSSELARELDSVVSTFAARHDLRIVLPLSSARHVGRFRALLAADIPVGVVLGVGSSRSLPASVMTACDYVIVDVRSVRGVPALQSTAADCWEADRPLSIYVSAEASTALPDVYTLLPSEVWLPVDSLTPWNMPGVDDSDSTRLVAQRVS
jgi:hypothetical protein